MKMVKIEFRGALLEVPEDVKLDDTVRSVFSNRFGEHPLRIIDTKEVLNEMRKEIECHIKRKKVADYAKPLDLSYLSLTS